MISMLLTIQPELSFNQFSLVYNALSLCIAGMIAAALFFFNAKSLVSPKYRPAILISGVIVSIAAYHYFRIFNSWDAAFTLQDGFYVTTGEPFNDAYRYADWLLTVPLLLTEAIAVLALSAQVARPLIIKLAVAAVLMLVTGYPGEISDSITARAIWGAVSTIPFAYILYVLWVELGNSIERQPQAVKSLIGNMRWLLLISWGVYPIAYLLPEVGIAGANALVGVQIGYTVADLLAKPVFGLFVYRIAQTKTNLDTESAADGQAQGSPTESGREFASTRN
jgi:bacteriorhodopsin